MQYGQPFKAFFQSTDPRARNKLITGFLLALGSVVLALVIVGIAGFFILSGYMLRLLRNVQDNQEHPIPEWDQWKADLRNGFFLFVAVVVWSLPLFILTSVVSFAENEAANALVSILTTVAYWIFLPGIMIALSQNMKLTDAFRLSNIAAWTTQNWRRCLWINAIVFLLYIIPVVLPISMIAIGVIGAAVNVLAMDYGTSWSDWLFWAGIVLMVTISPIGLLIGTFCQNHLTGQLARSSDLAVMFPARVDHS